MFPRHNVLTVQGHVVSDEMIVEAFSAVLRLRLIRIGHQILQITVEHDSVDVLVSGLSERNLKDDLTSLNYEFEMLNLQKARVRVSPFGLNLNV